MGEKLIATLPLLQDAQFIVVDEDEHALNADNLLDSWMQMWSSTSFPQTINLLLFFNSKTHYDYLSKNFNSDKLKIHDYFTEDLDTVYNDEDMNLDSILNNNNIVNEKSIVVINCLSSLSVVAGLGKSIRFIEKLSRRVFQLICIYRRDFGKQKIPNVETLGTTHVVLGKSKETPLIGEMAYEVFMVHRKSGGGILKKNAIITQDLITNEIKSEKVIEKLTAPTVSSNPEPQIKPQASFRMDMNARELEQKNRTPLPYIINSDTKPVKEFEIHYTPDANDDFDEEDPDDDLPF